MKNQLKVEITEMFVAKPDKDRVYFGCIKRSRNEKGEMNLFSRIAMPDGGVLCANETDQKVLAKNLNSMTVMILDMNIHNVSPKISCYCPSNPIVRLDDKGEKQYYLPNNPEIRLDITITHTMFLN